MVVGDGAAGHRIAGGFAHGVGVVFVFDAEPLIEGGIVEAGDVAGGVDVGFVGTQGGVDADAVVDGNSGGLREFDVGLNADTGDHSVHDAFVRALGAGIQDFEN